MAHAQQHHQRTGSSYQTPTQRGGRGRSTSTDEFGATFYPGRDDYMMPELNIVSPAPQRLMPEVPIQIADSLEQLEASSQRAAPRNASSQRGHPDSYATPPPSSQGPGSRPASEDRRSSYHSSIAADDYLGHFDSHRAPAPPPPFPRLVDPGPNIPPSDDEKEMQIEGARMDVLSSNDPEMQLVWAQDALNYVDIAMNHYTRLADPPDRPQTPPLEHQIRTDAINVVGFLADQHHPRAEFMRGNWLEFGKFGFPVDKKEAFRCYARAAEKGYARAEYRMGMQFENSGEPQKAIQRYERGARAGDSASNYRLGMMTLLGQHGYKQEFARGCQLIQIAAETADENAPQGAYVYGMLLARELPGIDVPEGFLPVDIQLAREMIEKAAFLGFARAQLKMGTAYELCQLGCEFDPAMSLHYNALASRQGEPEADMAISKWFLCGHDGVFDKNEQLAYEYAKRAATAGLGTAEFAIGYFYEIGMYVQVDLKEAQRWYARAAEHGNKDASGRIDGISRSKTLSRKDHENVAISKIRARHASMRKENPLTARRAAAAAATAQAGQPAPIEEVDMPEPSIPSGGQYNYPQGPPLAPPVAPLVPQHMAPSRHASIPPLNTSFIIDPQSTIHPPPRSGTALPYPRPRSSVGPNPLRPSSTAGNVNGMIPPAGTYPASPPRTNTAMSSMSGHGPGPGPGPYGRPPPPGGPGGGRQQFPGPQGPLHGPGGNHRPPPVDIGFEAPIPRPVRSPAPRPPKSPAPPGGGHPGRLPVGAGGPPAPMSPGPNGKPVGLSSSPSPMGGWSAPPPPQAKPQQQQQQPSAPEPSPTPKPTFAPPRPAGKGPKTFEEMGVPQQQKEQDCCIM